MWGNTKRTRNLNEEKHCNPESHDYGKGKTEFLTFLRQERKKTVESTVFTLKQAAWI